MTDLERTLAIDYGERRVGLAISNPEIEFVTGLPTIDRRKLRGALVDEIARIVETEGVERVVLGLPLTLEGMTGTQAREVRRFGLELSERITVPIEEWDERLTTEAARRALRETGHDERSMRDKVDQLSAVLMLESFLRSRAIREEEE